MSCSVESSSVDTGLAVGSAVGVAGGGRMVSVGLVIGGLVADGLDVITGGLVAVSLVPCKKWGWMSKKNVEQMQCLNK